MEIIPTHHFQPDIALWGFRIGEPVIALTGLFVTAVCVYAWLRLGRKLVQDDVLRLSRYFFLFTALSTLIGAFVGHAFLYMLPFTFKLPGWMLGMVAVSALEQASIIKAEPMIGTTGRKLLTWFNIGKLTLAFWFVSSTLWFPCVEIHAGAGFLLTVAPLEALLWYKHQSPGSKNMLLGIFALVGAVLAHISKLSLGPWFCYFDIAHLMMCVAMWQLMLGGERFSPATTDVVLP